MTSSSLALVTICQDEADSRGTPLRWYLESVVHLSTVMGDKLREVVIVDGGSKDRTMELLESYRQKAPLKIFSRPFDCVRDQQNFALDQLTSDATHVFTPDADMTWTTNFGDRFLAGGFDAYPMWDLLIYFTARDAYHYFHRWPLGGNMRVHRRGPRWKQERKFHAELEGHHPGLPICSGIGLFENSCRIHDESALRWRGERRQWCAEEMAAEGGGPGPADRFITTVQSITDDAVAALPQAIAQYVLPSTNLLE